VPRLDELRHHVPERAQVVAFDDDHQTAEQRRGQGESFVRSAQGHLRPLNAPKLGSITSGFAR
jgi:hypothetical protein